MSTSLSIETLNTYLFPFYKKNIKNIKESIAEKNNIFIYSEPGVKKAPILKNIQKQLSNSHHCIYFDINKAYSAKSLLAYMTKETLKSHSTKLKDMFDFASKYMPNLKPEISRQNPLKTDVMINYSINESVITSFIKQIFDGFEQIAKDKKTRLLIIFNNFDNIINIDKRRIEEILRDKINKQQNVDYLFICSKEESIAKIFHKKYASKYGIKKMEVLENLPKSTISQYILKGFTDNKIEINEQLITNAINNCSNIHNSILLAKKLYNTKLSGEELNRKSITSTINNIINDLEPLYSSLWDSLSSHQKTLLSTIATKGGSQIFSAKFIFENDLGSAPSVQTSINALSKKNILYKNSSKEFIFCDNFFCDFIKQLLV